MLKVIMIFLKLSLLHYDSKEIDDYLHQEIVINNVLLTEEVYSKIHTVAKSALVSKKLTYAFLIGRNIDSIILSIILSFVVLLPNLLIYMAIITFFVTQVSDDKLNAIVNATTPIIAAYFAIKGIKLLKDGYKHFSNIVFFIIFILAFILIFVLEISIIIVLPLFLILFLFFTKGGEYND